MKRTNAIIALIIIGMMFGSTFAFASLQSFFYSPPQQQTVQPPSAIVTKSFTSDQRSYLLQNGATVVSFKYNIACLECGDMKSFVESITRSSGFSGQVFLEELTGYNSTSVEIASLRGSNTVKNVTQEAISDSLCELMLQPPVNCALRKV